jgi:hypothetical protein
VAVGVPGIHPWQHSPPLLEANGGADPHFTPTCGAWQQMGGQRLVAGPRADVEQAGDMREEWSGPHSTELGPKLAKLLQGAISFQLSVFSIVFLLLLSGMQYSTEQRHTTA